MDGKITIPQLMMAEEYLKKAQENVIRAAHLIEVHAGRKAGIDLVMIHYDICNNIDRIEALIAREEQEK